MRVVESERPHDCLRIVVASLLEVELVDVPWIDAGDELSDTTWPALWHELLEWLDRRGWHLLWRDVDDVAFDGWLASMAGSRHYVIASVTHDDFEGWAHAIVTRGDDVVLYPPLGRPEPPLHELQLAGVGLLVAVDPAAFALVDVVA